MDSTVRYMLFKEYRLGFKQRLHPINDFSFFLYTLDGQRPLLFPRYVIESVIPNEPH